MSSLIRFLTVILLVLSLALAGSHASAIELNITDLGTDFVPNSGSSDGALAGYLRSTNQAAVRMPDGLIPLLGSLGGAISRATHISGDTVAGWSQVVEQGETRITSWRSFQLGTIEDLGVGLVNQSTNQPLDDAPAGIDAEGNVFITPRNLSANGVVRWNASNGQLSTLTQTLSAYGVNAAGDYAGRTPGGQAYLFDGSFQSLGFGFIPQAGLSDTKLLAGVTANTAAFYRPGESGIQLFDSIQELGLISEATGVHDDTLAGNTNRTVFWYDTNDGLLIDLNEVAMAGDTFESLTTIRGMTADGKLFGSGTKDGETHYFVAELTVADTLHGDYNGDGRVNAADYTVWRDSLGSETNLIADGNGSQVIDQLDYELWAFNFGDSAVAVADAVTNAASVPEPTSVLMLLTLAMGCLRVQRRSR